MKKSVLKIAFSILFASLATTGAFLFFYFNADSPVPSDKFTLVFNGREPVMITSGSFAADLGEALANGRVTLFSQGEKIASLLSEEATYSFYRTDDGLCITTGPKNARSYLLSADTAAALAQHEGLSPAYREVSPRPLIIMSGERQTHIPPMGGEWEYLGLDGRMHSYAFGEMCPQSMILNEDTTLSYQFEGASIAPYVLFGDDEYAQISGEDTQGSWEIPEGQAITLSASPFYDTEFYRGTLSFAVTFDATGDDPYTSGASAQYGDSDPVLDAPEINEPMSAPEAAVKTVGELVFSISATSTYPGEMLTLVVEGALADEISCSTTLRATPKFFDSENGAIALMPVRLSVEPGTYHLSLTAGGETEDWTILVQHKEFVVQHLEVSQATAEETILSDEANREYNQKVEPLKYVYDSEVYWSGNFILPTQGRITTEFGTVRYTNNNPVPSYHAAIDIGAAKGSQVKAAHSGRVLFSEYIALTGNTILIEHGIGLKSWYYHMDSLAVSAGAMVTQGQVIGAVGSTGFSTGPHLHFGMSVGEYYVNPWSFID